MLGGSAFSLSVAAESGLVLHGGVMRGFSPRSLSASLIAFCCFGSIFTLNESHVAAQVSGDSDVDSISAMVRFGTPPGSDGRDESGCTWRPFFDYENSSSPPLEPPSITSGDFTFKLWFRDCPFGWEAYWIPEIDRETLGSISRNRVERLIPSLPLDTAPPNDKFVVSVGTWFWVPAALWVKFSVTAWIPTPTGVLTATTEAEPRDLIFTPGDGVFGSGPVTCNGPGAVWFKVYGDRRVSPCMYTYTHSSSLSRDGYFHGSATTVWEVSWSSNAGIGGPLPDISTTSDYRFRVRELHALVR